MRGSNEIRLTRNVQNPRAVPVMACASDKHLVRPIPGACVVAVVAHVAPHIARAVDEHQAWRGDVEVAVLVVGRHVGAAGRRYGLWG